MKLTSENLKYHFNKLIKKLRLIYQYIYVLRFKLFGDKHIKEIIVENRIHQIQYNNLVKYFLYS